MLLNLMKSKIHCATVTEANLAYMGSITIDEALMEAAHIVAHERVQVVDNNNGARLETYVIAGGRGSGVICLNGAAARCVQPGDVVIIMSYAMMTEDEARAHTPTVVMVDGENRLQETRRAARHDRLKRRQRAEKLLFVTSSYKSQLSFWGAALAYQRGGRPIFLSAPLQVTLIYGNISLVIFMHYCPLTMEVDLWKILYHFSIPSIPCSGGRHSSPCSWVRASS